jgi:hypothetical protein
MPQILRTVLLADLVTNFLEREAVFKGGTRLQIGLVRTLGSTRAR